MPNNLDPKIFGTTKFLVQQIFLHQKSKKYSVQKMLGPKMFVSKEVFFQKKILARQN